jgi:hypothetical protein
MHGPSILVISLCLLAFGLKKNPLFSYFKKSSNKAYRRSAFLLDELSIQDNDYIFFYNK